MCFTSPQERLACHDGPRGGLDVASGSWRDARGGRKFLVGQGLQMFDLVEHRSELR
jgi:hypothetical protein